VKFGLEPFTLQLSTEPCLEQAYKVGCRCVQRQFPENLSHRLVQTCTQVTELVLIVPVQVSSHVLELQQERVQASTAVEALELEQHVLGLGTC